MYLDAINHITERIADTHDKIGAVKSPDQDGPVRRPSTPPVKYSDTVRICSRLRSIRPRAQIAGTPPGTALNLGKSDVGATVLFELTI